MLKILMKSLKEHKKTSLITIFLSVIGVIFEIIIPLCMADLIDFGINNKNINDVFKYGTVLLIIALLDLIIGMLSAHIGAKASTGFAANLRQDMYDNVQTFSFSNIDKFSTASIITRLTTDVTNVQNAYQMLIRIAIRVPIMIIFSIIVSFRINNKISLIFLIIIPILTTLLIIIVLKVHPIFQKVFHDYDNLNNVVQENLKGIRIVKSFNQENYEINKFKKISKYIYENFAKAERLLAFNSPLMQGCMYICMILISWISAKAIIASGNNSAFGLTTGNMTALISYAIQILSSLMMLSMVFAMITIASSSSQRIAEILKEKPDITNPQDPIYEVKNGDIEFKNVNFVYDSNSNKKILDNINLHISSGQIIGIIGGTGSSKSSLVQLIPRLYDVNNGSVVLGGIDVRKYHLNTLRNSVAMVLQKNQLFSGTIKENLLFGNENATMEEIEEACRLAQADEFIKNMPEGYNTYIEQDGTNVSGGQKQRLCIARALLKKPKVLILDDSTSALDTKTDALVQKSFREYIPNTTKIIIAHRISSIQHADQIFVMDDGKIVSIGKHEQLLEKCNIYSEIFESQKKGEHGYEPKSKT